MSLRIIGGATARTMRAHWAAHELGIDYDSELIGSRTGATQQPEFLSLNPKEKIPVLVDDGLVLTESAAIITYLSRCSGKSTAQGGLLPETTEDLARYDEWQSFILMELDAQSLYVMRKHGDLAHIYGTAPAAMDTARACFTKQIPVVIHTLNARQYLVGNAFSGVDILLTSCLEWALAYEFTLDAALHAYLERMRARPAYQSARAHNFSISAGA